MRISSSFANSHCDFRLLLTVPQIRRFWQKKLGIFKAETGNTVCSIAAVTSRPAPSSTAAVVFLQSAFKTRLTATERPCASCTFALRRYVNDNKLKVSISIFSVLFFTNATSFERETGLTAALSGFSNCQN